MRAAGPLCAASRGGVARPPPPCAAVAAAGCPRVRPSASALSCLHPARCPAAASTSARAGPERRKTVPAAALLWCAVPQALQSPGGMKRPLQPVRAWGCLRRRCPACTQAGAAHRRRTPRTRSQLGASHYHYHSSVSSLEICQPRLPVQAARPPPCLSLQDEPIPGPPPPSPPPSPPSPPPPPPK